MDRLHLYYVVGGQFDYCISGERLAICRPHAFDPYRKIFPFKDNICFMYLGVSSCKLSSLSAITVTKLENVCGVFVCVCVVCVGCVYYIYIYIYIYISR